MKDTLEIDLGFQEGEFEPFDPFIIPNRIKKLLVISDLHIPYHNKKALNAAILYGLREKVDGILINGDLTDFYQGSRFEKDPRKRGLKAEIEETRLFLKTLRKNFGGYIVFKPGNHDERWEKYLMIKAPELLDMAEFRLETILHLKECDIEITREKQKIQHGKLNFLHGHEFPSGMAAPVNPARGFFLKAKVSIVGGHHHQTSEHTEPDLNDKIVTAWSTGCLCELHPKYMPYNKWNHGFGINELIDEEGNFRFRNYRISNGEVI